MIPGLENTEFVWLGSVHRNTFLNGPVLLNPQLSLKIHPNMFFTGQIAGVKGYMESIVMVILAARQIAMELENRLEIPTSPDTMTGALIRYITETEFSTFQPINANFGLLKLPEKKMNNSELRIWYAELALKKDTQ